ncbi:retropepsin-like aspartic protease family protein [Roseibium polysiphoniae]|uniref:TIGR02281 family clan AA aspartic protease n=1 Tax=Roseibium polysiphoniae TaxID=2571221 RepID=A0ABR9C527_9HYPH|nr:TIGR02281 family clan AA aspartic protease [Roseibium polysiphoniae]MBD8874979.1 TIGR02281 family clan AA aspartic protease [Roseibium polysiphoniae]
MRGIRGIVIGVLITVMAGAGLYALVDFSGDPDNLDFDQTGPRIVALSVLAFVFVASLVFGQPRVRDIVQGVFFWGGLLALLVVGYTFRADLIQGGYRVLGALAPGLAVPQDDGTILIVRDASGHFSLEANTNGAKTRFLLDTGASAVVLTREDAARAGFSDSELTFSVPVQTANGGALVAPVRVRTLSVGDLSLTDVRAFVAREGALDTSLFGMTALNRLSSWRIEGDRLVLTP